jgi:hypothetical protein
VPQNFLFPQRDQPLLLPVVMREWLPEDDLVFVVLDAVATLDLGEFRRRCRAGGHGRAAFDPEMMVALLLYGYCQGERSSQVIDRYIRVRARHAQAWRPQLWLGVNNRGPMTAQGIYQMIVRRGRQCEMRVHPHRFRHHFSHTWLDRGGAEGDLMELNGWASPQMLRRYGASARSARARRTYDRIMTGKP